MKKILYLLLVLSPVAYSQLDTVTIYFDIDQYILSNTQKETLMSVRNDINNGDALLESVQAHTDTSGSVMHNNVLSENRLNAVLNEITNRPRVTNNKSYGEAIASKAVNYKASEFRKVDVILSRPRLTVDTQESQPEIISDEKRLDNELSTFLSDSTNEALIQLTVNFYPGRAILLEGEEAELNTLYTFLKNNPQVKAKIRGHVCCGSNLQLSQARAMVVFDYLTSKGISSIRLSHRGYDNSQPFIWPEITEEDKMKNRRVDVIFSK